MGDQLRFVDDSGDTRLAGELVDDGATVGDVLTVQSDGSLAAAPGGGSSSVVVSSHPFAFDTAGLTNGHTLYTPTVGDLLLDAWIDVLTAWDGTTPQADIGTFVGANGGLFNWSVPSSGAVDLTQAVQEPAGTGVALPGGLPLAAMNPLYDTGSVWEVNTGTFSAVVGQSLALASNGGVPARFTAANPIKVVVSQTGQKGGADPGATQGSAVLYLVTATPT